MRVDALQIQGWRNYGQQELTFDESCNVIYGENAQGKTNLPSCISAAEKARGPTGTRN